MTVQVPSWSGCNARELAWRCWGDETAVYHSATGSTHLLTAAAGRLLQLLAADARARTPEDWALELARVDVFVSAEEAADILFGLEAVGLAHTASN